jgi:hypothetical protein
VKHNGVTVPRDRVVVDAGGATVALPGGGQLRLTLDDLYDLRVAVEGAGLAAWESDGLVQPRAEEPARAYGARIVGSDGEGG